METKLIPAPIDNKNLLEDPFEDEVFNEFYAAYDHRKSNKRHLIGTLCEPRMFLDAIVEVSWNYGDSKICINVLATPLDIEETRKEVYDYYTEIFKSWECPENEYLRVKTHESDDKLYVSFYFEVD